MSIVLSGQGPDRLDDTVAVLAQWQREGMPVQLHPGDLGWHSRFGAERAAATLRTWSRDGRPLAVGSLDGTEVRLAIAPDAQLDDELARRLVEDLSDPARGVLIGDEAVVEAPRGALVRDLLSEAGWWDHRPWTPLRRELGAPVEEPGVRVELVVGELVTLRTAVQRAAFDSSTFTDELWHVMAARRAYADARCLLALDDAGHAVAAITVWSAGPGRPGLIEPMGVHREHRGHGYGRAITIAGAAALRELGASSAVVCTPSDNEAAVATYASAGFEPLPATPDLRRPSFAVVGVE